MTATQFAALVKLLRIREGAAKQAAYLVLVDGQQQAATARQTGLSPSGVGNVLARFRRGLALAKTAVNHQPD